MKIAILDLGAVEGYGVNAFEIGLRKDAGFVNPVKLAMLKRVYDAICAEAAIQTTAERNALAERLVTVSGIMDDESQLLGFARKALAEYRATTSPSS